MTAASVAISVVLVVGVFLTLGGWVNPEPVMPEQQDRCPRPAALGYPIGLEDETTSGQPPLRCWNAGAWRGARAETVLAAVLGVPRCRSGRPRRAPGQPASAQRSWLACRCKGVWRCGSGGRESC